jgi:heme-degrading monooxygenase HmoA
MINVGIHYKIKKGYEKNFENTFSNILNFLKENYRGFIDAKLYRRVDEPNEYMIYSEWDSLESFKNFIESDAYKKTIEYGRSIVEGRPKHRIYKEIQS